jgi:hypothetical protein
MYVPSLSCYEKPVQVCNQDVGDDPLSFEDIQCVLAQNPTANPVRFNISVSFTKSVFENPFTSPGVPGGTAASSDSIKIYGFNDLFVTMLFSFILIYNTIELL